MGQAESAPGTIELCVENVGGITETTVELSPGVTVLTGRNATNRTSFLQALMAALGSDRASVKGDAEAARVEFAVGGTTYIRRLRRESESIVTDGDPYLADATLADLFAFLLEGNEARRAVARSDDLRDVIMRPVDTDQLQAQIAELRKERREIDAQLDELASLKQRLPELEGERADIQERIDTTREELAATREEIDATDANIEAQREEQEQLEAQLEELNQLRSRLDTVRREIDTHQDSVDALEDERAELQADREEYSEIPDGRREEIDDELKRLRRQLEATETRLDKLQTVIEFNEEFLDGSLDLFSDLDDGDTGGAVTDPLLEEDDLVCWTCGSDTDTDQIDAMLDRLRELRSRAMRRHNDLEARIDELETERLEHEERQRQYEQITSRLDDIEAEIHHHEERIAELQERRDSLADQIEDVETEVEQLRADDQDELLDLHEAANRLEIEINRLEDDRQEVEDRIESVEDQIAREESLKDRREETESEIEQLRTRVQRLEEEAITEFNAHMDALLDILGFENLERIWIERTEREVRDGHRKVTQTQFDLHIVRSSASGTVYEDTIEHLSESEREVTGLVFALAGYLAHELYEDVPFLLLDSLEALDAERIAALVDYFHEYADYLVVALLTEDAAALDSDYQRVTDI